MKNETENSLMSLNLNLIGKSKVPVADCNKQFFNAQEKVDMEVESFLEYWEEYILSGHLKESPCLYLKVHLQWHLFHRSIKNLSILRTGISPRNILITMRMIGLTFLLPTG
jgi:hypothetical protein